MPKNLIEQELYRALGDGGTESFFRPLRLGIASSMAPLRDLGLDGVLTVTWRDRVHLFGFQCKHTWSVLSMQRFKERVEGAQKGFLPLLVTSYLSDGQLDELEKAGVSGIDLNGNGLLQVPPELYVRRNGAKDRRKVETPVATIYRSWKVASLVPRVLVVQGFFPTVQSVQDMCRGRMMAVEGVELPLRISTVSKALSLLEKDLVVARVGRETRLLDPDRLLDRLIGAYRPPVATARFVGRTRLAGGQIWAALDRLSGVRAVMTGRCTAPRHSELVGAERVQLHVSDAVQVVTALSATATEAFPNLELIETGEEGVYFDAHREDGANWASRLQTLLELSAGDAREVEAARSLRARLLADMHAAVRLEKRG